MAEFGLWSTTQEIGAARARYADFPGSRLRYGTSAAQGGGFTSGRREIISMLRQRGLQAACDGNQGRIHALDERQDSR